MLGIKRQEPGGRQSPGSFWYAQSVSLAPRGGRTRGGRLLSVWPLRKSPGLRIDGQGDEHDLFHRRRHCTPVGLSGGGRSLQFGRTSAPIMPHLEQTVCPKADDPKKK